MLIPQSRPRSRRFDFDTPRSDRRRETLTEGTAESFGLARERSLDSPLHGISPSMAASGARMRFEKT